MSEQEYIENRVKDQIKWYDNKSISNHKWFKCLKNIEIICAVLIPFLAAYVSPFWTGLLGAIIAIIAGVLSIYKFQDNWVKYRATSEKLKQHLYLFQTKTTPYSENNPFNMFVSDIENILRTENKEWQDYIVNDSVASESSTSR